VEDVIRNMRAEFANEGLDDQVLEDLKQIWENKLLQAGVYEFPNTAPAQNYAYDLTNYNPYLPDASHTTQTNTMLPMTQAPMYNTNPYLGQTAPRTTAAHLAAMNALRSLNTTQTNTNTLPASTVQSNAYGFDPSGKPQQYMPPPGSIAGWNSQPSNANTQYISNIRQHDGASDEVDTTTQERQKIDAILLKKFAQAQKQKQKKQNKKQTKDATTTTTTIPQFDGLGDRKADGDGDDDDEEEDDDEAGSAKGDEELGSDLDDEDDEEEPDTEHIILCQYEKVTRVKNKRKANLKDGIMHINGRDYVFSKANGEFDW